MEWDERHSRRGAKRGSQNHNTKKSAEILRGVGKVCKGRPRGKKVELEGRSRVKGND